MSDRCDNPATIYGHILWNVDVGYLHYGRSSICRTNIAQFIISRSNTLFGQSESTLLHYVVGWLVEFDILETVMIIAGLGTHCDFIVLSHWEIRLLAP